MTIGNQTKSNIDKAKELIELNFDSRQYFYTKADERWLKPLWEAGLLDILKKKADDPNTLSFRMPELEYLVRMAKTVPQLVTDIILSVKSTPESFNPEVIDRFLWIVSDLPAEYSARIIPIIQSENWVKLMEKFNHFGFTYEKTFKSLASAEDYASIIRLAEPVLSLVTKEEMRKGHRGHSFDTPFYINEISYTQVFHYLESVDDNHVEPALALATKVLENYLKLGDIPEKQGPFAIEEGFYLFGVDVFNLTVGQKKSLSLRDDIRDLVALLKVLLDRLLKLKAKDSTSIKAIHEKYIKSLPQTKTIWRLGAYLFSLYKDIFTEEIEKELFRTFEYDELYDFVSGPEYEHLVKFGFPTLDEAKQRLYVSRVIEHFTKINWKEAGRAILSSALPHLKEGEIKQAESAFGTLIKNYVPIASGSSSIEGYVVSQSPGDDASWKRSVPEIIQSLKDEWDPAVLKEKDRGGDILHPIDAEGAGGRLKTEMSLRPEEFLKDAPLFFDRNKLHPHYTFVFIRNLYDLIRENKISIKSDLSGLYALIDSIIGSSSESVFEERPEEIKGREYWTGYWDSMNNAMADLIKEILGRIQKDSTFDFPILRNWYLKVIKYLLEDSDPSVEDEVIETAKHKTKTADDPDYILGDPFTTAINSTRGKAFQALITFIYCEGLNNPKGSEPKLSEDVMRIYMELLRKENTRAIMFMFGHYLPTFYYRDSNWIKGLLPEIFPMTKDKEHLRLSAWEGYLATNLYKEMFFDPEIQSLYKTALASPPKDTTKRKYFRDPEEGIATHLALAFMHYEEFGFTHPLFKYFWFSNIKGHTEFVSFIGRSFVTGENQNANELLKKDPKSKERLKELWDWTLKTFKKSEIFNEFDYWLSLEKEIFDPSWLANKIKETLGKTKGQIDWDYGLTKCVVTMSKIAPKDVLEIARLHFFDGGIKTVHHKGPKGPLYVEAEWYEAFKILYENPDTRDGTYKLIDDLVREGGRPFWGLKAIIKKPPETITP